MDTILSVRERRVNEFCDALQAQERPKGKSLLKSRMGTALRLVVVYSIASRFFINVSRSGNLSKTAGGRRLELHPKCADMSLITSAKTLVIAMFSVTLSLSVFSAPAKMGRLVGE
jgi:hypothetical protein